MNVSVRRASAADAHSLAELAAETFPLACPPHATPESIAAFIAEHLTVARFTRYLGDSARTILIASEASVPVGYSMLVSGEPTDRDVRASIRLHPTIELSKFYTRATVHGAGIASPLMVATLEAAAPNAVGIWLGVNEENARAIRFYQKHGFEQVGRKRFRVGDRLEDDWVLERALP